MRPIIAVLILITGLSLGNKTTAQSVFKENKDRLVPTIRYNTWLNKPEEVKLKWYSYGIDITYVLDLGLGNSPFSFGIGAGLSFDNYFLKDHRLTTEFNADSVNQLTFYIPEDTGNFKRNRLFTSYLDIPFEFRWRSKKDDSGNTWKIAIGLKGGRYLASYEKFTGGGIGFGLNRNENKEKTYNIPYLRKFRLLGTFRVGYGAVNVIANYSLLPWLNDDGGPDLLPLTIGISFNNL